MVRHLRVRREALLSLQLGVEAGRHALRQLGEGCPGKASDFEPVLTDNTTPGSPAFVRGQQVAAQIREDKRAQAVRRRAERAARDDRVGRAGRADPPAAAAAPRRADWGTTPYAPDGPSHWAGNLPRGDGADPCGPGTSVVPNVALPTVLLARAAVCSAAAEAGPGDLRGSPEDTLASDAWFRRGEEIARIFDAAFGQPAKDRALGSPAEPLASEAASGQRGTAPQDVEAPVIRDRASCTDNTAGGGASEARTQPAAAFGQAGAQQEPIGTRTTVLRCERALGRVPEPRAGGRRRGRADTDTEAPAEDQAPNCQDSCPPSISST